MCEEWAILYVQQCPSPHSTKMKLAMDYKLREKDCKQYSHFDAPVRKKYLQALIEDPLAVEKHAFFPFLVYSKEKNSLKRRKERKDIKQRPIRYAARADAAIFAAYRSVLAELYEAELSVRGLSDTVLAYRRLKKPSGSGKCNIDFADEAFKLIQSHDRCTVFAFDIASYFENIDHQVLKAQWQKLLNCSQLPKDHYQVYKAITSYRYVDKEAVYKALGYDKTAKIPEQLCRPEVFRKKIAKAGLIKKNDATCGIPQGSPMSDVLANLYLIDFDVAMKAYAVSKGGSYLRYSDDILLIIPDGTEPSDVSKKLADELAKCGSKLEISPGKTVITEFFRNHNYLNYRQISKGKVVNGVEYLGFRFDGQRIYLRDSTVSSLKRKISRVCKIYARKHYSLHPADSLASLLESFDYRVIEQQFGRVPNFEPHCDKTKWTFRTYAKKSVRCFGAQGRSIDKQLRGQKAFIRKRFEHHLRRAIAKKALA